MKNSKVFELIASMPYKEKKQFKDFIRSPYFNRSDRVIVLYQLIVDQVSGNETNSITKEHIHSKVFPNRVYKDQELRDLMKSLVKLLEDFFIQIELQNDLLGSGMKLLSSYRKRKLDKYFNSSLANINQLFNKHSYRDDQYYLNDYLLEIEKNLFIEQKFRRTDESNLEQISGSLDLFYLTRKLRHSCEIINLKNVLASDSKLFLLEEILSYINKNIEKFENTGAISIYHKVLMSLEESENESHYFDLLGLLEKHSDEFTQSESRNMYAYAQNYCIRKINEGNTNYLNELFDLYRILLDKEIILEDKNISPWDYKNIVTVGLRVEEIEWTKKFIHDYEKKIAVEFRKNAFTYNLACLHFHQKEYTKALKLFQEVDFTDVYYSLDSKSKLLKIYYELEEVEGLYSLIDSFRTYLRRNKLISDYQKTVYLNLIKYVKKAMQIKLNGNDTKKIIVLKNEVESNKQVADINWLTAKLDDLN